MMNTRTSLLLTTLLTNNNEYSGFYFGDEMVNECIMNLYFYMLLSNSDDVKKEEYFLKLEESFIKLNEEQREIVRKEYIDIIEAQKKNNEKVKKKGMINYE